MSKSATRSPGDVLETFNFLENADDSDEEEDEEGDLMEEESDRTIKHRIKKHKVKVMMKTHTHTHTHTHTLQAG